VLRKALATSLLVTAIAAPSGTRADDQYPFPYPYPPPYPGVALVRGGELRFLVEPKETQVFIDGYYSGIAYDSAGLFQHCHVAPGDRKITLHLEGYKTVTQKVSVTPGATYKLHYSMERLPAGAVSEPPPAPAAIQQPTAQPVPPPRPALLRPVPQAPPALGPPPAPTSSSSIGALVFRVQPGGSEIVIDGGHSDGPDGDERLVVQVADGPHHVEIFKDGYRRFTTDLQVHGGETIPVNVSLSPDRP
jgi:hypothetical protein